MIINVVKYDPNWPKKFEDESKKLTSRLKYNIHKIYHIGSTAVPGIKAKPIIDILLDVKELYKIGMNLLGSFYKYFVTGVLNL